MLQILDKITFMVTVLSQDNPNIKLKCLYLPIEIKDIIPIKCLPT